MQQRRIIGAIALAALLATSLPSVAATPDASGSVPSGVVRETLPNGMRVVIVPDRLAPVVTTELNYLVGSNDAPDGFPGTAHALEHMLFRGSEGLSKDQLYQLGGLLGGNYNASTTETVTKYTFTVPKDDLGIVLRIEASRMRGASLTQADWEQERGAIEQEVSADLSSPFYNYLSQAQAILFAGTPYAHDALGTRPSFDKTDAALLRKFYDTWYAPNNAILVIAGDVVPADALAQARAAFGGIAAQPLPPHAHADAGPVVPETLTLPTNFSVGLVALAYRMPGLNAKDFAAADVLSDVLDSQRYALHGLVTDGRALMSQYQYDAKAGVGVGLAFAAFPTGGDPAPLLADMRRVFADLVQGGVPPDLVAASKRSEIAQLAAANDSISGLAGSWSRALADQNLNSPDDMVAAYEAVTPDDVNRVARKLLGPEQAVVAILTPRSSDNPVPASNGFGGAESFSAPPDHPVALPAWAEAAFAELPAPQVVDAPDVSLLANGLLLIVQPEHVSKTVSVYGRVRGVADMQQPAGKDGLAGLMDRLFDYGTQQHDRIAYEKAFDDIAATHSAGPSFSLRVLTPDFERGMRLLAEGELQPAFRPEDVEQVKRQTAQRLTGLLPSPDYRFRRALDKALVPEGDPSLREPTPQSVSALQPADVRAFHAATFRPDLTTIVVIGDITPEEARRVVTETFGAWRVEGATPAIDLPPVGANVPSSARVPDSSALQDRVSLAETVLAPVKGPDRYALILGNTILGGGFSSRLYRDLRVKTGYVYSVSSVVDWTRTRARYQIDFGADPENVDKARTAAIGDLRDMQANPVSDAELGLAKAQILRQLSMQRASVSAIARQYLRLVDLGLPLDAQRIAADNYRAMTAEQIKAAFAKWMRPDDLVEVVKGPAPTR